MGLKFGFFFFVKSNLLNANQKLSLDMLSRLATESTREQIVEVLLARKQVLAALRFSAKYPNMTVPGLFVCFFFQNRFSISC